MKGSGQIPTGETPDFYGKVLELHQWTMKTEEGGLGLGWFRGAELIECGYGATTNLARQDLDSRMKGNYPSLFN